MSKTITNKKKGGAKNVIAVVAVILAFVIVGGLVVAYNVVESGFIQRNSVAMSSENFEVSSAMMSYYFNTTYQNYVSSYSSMLETMGLDTSKPLESQKYTEKETWYDFFMSTTKSQVQQLLVLAEAAKAAGFEPDENDGHDHGSIDETIAAMEQNAKLYGVTLDYYLSAVYGASVNEKVLRQCVELSELASHYSEHIVEGYEFDKADWDKYYEDNVDSFNKVNYLSYTFKVEKAEVKKDATDDEKAAAEALDKAEAERLLNEANTLAATTDEKTFKTFVESYLRTDLYKDMTEEEMKEEKIDIDDEIEKLLVEGATNSSESELNKWLFDKERKGYETKVIKDDKALTYAVYMILPVEDNADLGLACMYRDAYTLKDYRYIPFLASEYKNSDKDAKAAAEKVFEEYKETATEEKFIALADPDKGYGDGAYEDALVEGADKTTIAAEVGDWAYDSARKEGDCEIVKVEGKGYYLVYFCGDNDIKWQVQADNGLKNEQYSSDISDLMDKHVVKAHSKGMGYVKEVDLGDTSSSSSK